MIDNVRDDISHKAETFRSELGAFGWLLRTAAMAAVAGAIYTELRKPPEERTWNGKLLGVVPYDFRLPSLDRLRAGVLEPALAEGLHRPAARRRLGDQHPDAPAPARRSPRVHQGPLSARSAALASEPMNWFPILLVTHIALAVALLLPSVLLPFVLRRSDARSRAA